jgi:sugar (pentulose or hexulose) kinase
MREFAAVDLGASNGRTILGQYDGQKIVLKELNRFENNYVKVGDAYYWDALRLYSCILEGLQNYVKGGGNALSGIGIDTWGVDFGLIDRQGRLAGNPRSYRDPRGERGYRAFQQKYGERKAFDLTGIANMNFNTLYQLYDMVQTEDPVLKIADKMLMMPDLLGYMLCGEKTTEYTNATTTQMLSSVTGEWSADILNMAGLQETLFTRIQMSGETKGELMPAIREDTGLKGIPRVFCVGSHDTASAVASVPAATEDFAFISSGTWSLMGVVADRAIINDAVYQNSLSNEGTITGSWRPLKNIMGLWIIQNCKRRWDREQQIGWDEIVALAKKAPAFKALVNVNDQLFFDGDNMPGKIQQYCRETGQSVPETKGEIARCVYESLAMGYRETFLDLEALKGSRIDVLHIVGGGSKNALLNEFTANAIGREVVAGPFEATAIGNLMVQVKAAGEVKNTAEMRQVIRNSFEVQSFEPQAHDLWLEQYDRYLKIKRA